MYSLGTWCHVSQLLQLWLKGANEELERVQAPSRSSFYVVLNLLCGVGVHRSQELGNGNLCLDFRRCREMPGSPGRRLLQGWDAQGEHRSGQCRRETGIGAPRRTSVRAVQKGNGHWSPKENIGQGSAEGKRALEPQGEHRSGQCRREMGIGAPRRTSVRAVQKGNGDWSPKENIGQGSAEGKWALEPQGEHRFAKVIAILTAVRWCSHRDFDLHFSDEAHRLV
ncbi:hypothetical protein AAY473_014959 [Plecturocebus cupreus]